MEWYSLITAVNYLNREVRWQGMNASNSQQEPHKRGCISKRISKNFLEIFLEIAMPYGVRIFWGSNKKEPKTLVNAGLSASFIVRYRLLKFLNFRHVDVPWKPFGGNPTWVRIPSSPPLANNTNPDDKLEFVLFFSNEYFGIKVDLDGKKKKLPGEIYRSAFLTPEIIPVTRNDNDTTFW